MSIVYRHRRVDTNEVFYVGIASGAHEDKRPHKKSNRSQFWKNIVSKTEYSVEILVRNISREDSCELEELLILEYGRKDLETGSLVNLTGGGEKNKSRVVPTERRERISKSLIGKTKTKTHCKNIKIGKILQCGTDKYKSFVSKQKSKPVLMYDMNNMFLKEYPSLTVAAKDIKGIVSSISNVCRGNRNSHRGYIWEHKKN